MTSNLSKYSDCFKSAFGLSKNTDPSDLQYQGIENWDSVGHMTLMSELEDAFDIILEMDDIIDFSSYAKGLETLAKYQVNFQE